MPLTTSLCPTLWQMMSTLLALALIASSTAASREKRIIVTSCTGWGPGCTKTGEANSPAPRTSQTGEIYNSDRDNDSGQNTISSSGNWGPGRRSLNKRLHGHVSNGDLMDILTGTQDGDLMDILTGTQDGV